MKWAQSLIRLADHRIEGLRKRVAYATECRVGCEARIAALDEEALREVRRADGDAEAGWYLVGFREGWRIRRTAAEVELATLQLEEQGARDALIAAFEELKRIEQVAEAARAAEARAAARKETAALDELALRRATR